MSLTMEIVTEALFSSDIANSIDELGRAITTLIASLVRHPESARHPWLPGVVSTMALARLDGTIYDIIATRRATQGVSEDLLACSSPPATRRPAKG